MAEAGGWRAADLRGDSGEPHSVAQVVRATQRTLSRFRWVESFALSLGVGGSVLAVMMLQGTALRGPDPWCVAGLPALLAGIAWRSPVAAIGDVRRRP